MRPKPSDARRRFEELALPLARSLLGAAQRLTDKREDAEEIVQETYLRAYRTFENFQKGSNAKAWLFTILYSIVKNRYRQASRRPAEPSLTDLEDHDSRWSAADSWGSHEKLLRGLDAHRVSTEIVEAFEALSPASRMIMLLVEVEGLDYEEVARIVDCPLGTVSSRLYRARKQLFESLEPFAREKGYVRE